MEQPIAELISMSDPLLYVIECMPNMYPAKNVTTKTIPLVDKIRENNSKAPIVFVELFVSSVSILDNNKQKENIAMNTALRTEYEKMINNGYENIYYIESNNALGLDQEGTVDSVHFTDLGFIRYADFLLQKFGEFKIIDPEIAY